jgi:hypothetical protein
MADYDPLFKLHQIEFVENSHIDREIVSLMIKIMDSIEDFDEISSDIKSLVKSEQSTTMIFLSMIESMIKILETEISMLSYLGFNFT